MTITTARLARRRIARKTGESMLRRLGLCSESHRKEGTPHHVAADPTPALARSIAASGTRTLPAEAASGRPGTAGTVTSATTHGTESVESWEHGKENDYASSTPGPRGPRADVRDAHDGSDPVVGPGLVARPRPRTESLPVHYAPAGRTDLR